MYCISIDQSIAKRNNIRSLCHASSSTAGSKFFAIDLVRVQKESNRLVLDLTPKRSMMTPATGRRTVFFMSRRESKRGNFVRETGSSRRRFFFVSRKRRCGPKGESSGRGRTRQRRDIHRAARGRAKDEKNTAKEMATKLK